MNSIEIIAGRKVLAEENRPHGKLQARRTLCLFRCDCGAEYWKLKASARNVERRSGVLLCAHCAKRATVNRMLSYQKEYRKIERVKPGVVELLNAGPLKDVGKPVLRRLLELPVAARRLAIKIITDHIKANMRLGSQIENAERVIVEAIEEAQRQAKGAPSYDWDGRDKWDGLQVTRYDQYYTRSEAV